MQTTHMIDRSSARHRRRALAFLVGATLLMPAWFAAHAESTIEIKDPRARATVPGQKVAGVYLEITSRENARVVGVRSTASKSAEIHSMSTQGGMMRMRRLDGIDLPGGQAVRFEPGGNHIMLLDIRAPLAPGQHVPVTLVISQKGNRRSIQVQAEVRPLDGGGSAHGHHE
jgi:periplasmic copper chaperone A